MKLSEVRSALSAGGIEDAAIEARRLFSHVSGLPERALFGTDSDCPSPALPVLLEKRLAGIPLAYLTGVAYFYNESYAVRPGVLIPRPDTELLAEEAIRRLPDGAHFADLCCGSGCIGISVLANRRDTTCDAFDISPVALSVTKENGERNNVSDRLSVGCADLFALPADLPRYSAILSNPPYIVRSVVPTLSREVQNEPILALDGGEDGLDFYRAIVAELPRLLLGDGFCLLEIGYDQEASIGEIARAGGYACTVRRDLGGNPRLAVLTR